MLYLLPLLIVIGLLLVSFGLNADEPFTLNLIHYSYKQLIYIDSFDVHPPLYYLALKFFLQITTFWTKSIIIKIIFARIFSLLSFAITFYYLTKILNLINIDINWKIQLVLYLVFPSILYYSTDIRMYQLATMFIALEIYGLLLFKYKNANKGLILSFISLLLVLYTNYFAAAFAGSIVIIELSKYIIFNNKGKALKLLLISIVDVILFSLYSKSFLHQIKYVSSNNYYNVGANMNKYINIIIQLLGAITSRPVLSKSTFCISLLFLIISIILGVMLLIKSTYKYKSLFITLIIAFILGMLPSIVLSLVSHPMITWRYGFPLFAIIYFILIAVVTNSIDQFKLNNKFILLIIMLMIGISVYSFDSDKSYSNNDLLTITPIQRLLKNNKSHSIKINCFYNNSDTTKMTSQSVYLLNKDKRIEAYHVNIYGILGSNNRALMQKTFSNVSLNGKSK